MSPRIHLYCVVHPLLFVKLSFGKIWTKQFWDSWTESGKIKLGQF